MNAIFDKKTIQAHTIAETIIKASKDPKVTGLVVNAGKIDATMALFYEIREAIKMFRKAGKKTYFYANTFNEAAPGTILYWFASVFEEIHMCRAGLVNTVAFSGVQPFFRQMLDKIEAEPSLVTRKEYKSAGNMIYYDKFTDEHRESTEHILNTLYNQLIEDIAKARNLEVEAVKKLFERAPLSAEDAKNSGLIDNICYEDEFYSKHLVKAFGVKNKQSLNLLYLQKYRARVGGLYGKGKVHIAVIHADGAIYHGSGEKDFFGEEKECYSQTVCNALKQASEDKNVKLIILRVNSPGGSAIASDVIARSVLLAKEAGKKIFISMGQYAASGGYYISAYAHRIFATPLTITGSIGVIGGKVNLKKTWNKIGVTFDEIETPESSSFYSSLSTYEEKNNETVNKLMDDIYGMFKGVVEEGRSLSEAQTEELARGRVWIATKDIKDKGLIDEIGGFHYTIEMAKKELGLGENESVLVKHFPRQPSVLSSLFSSGKNSLKSTSAYGVSIMNILSTVGWLNRVIQTPQLRAILKTIPLLRMENLNEITMTPSLYYAGEESL